MPEVSFGARRAAVRAVAFDKDGTLLATEPFWRELFRIRYDLVCQAAGAVAARHWQDLMGISEAGEFDRAGPFALGSLEDEALVTAVALYSHTRKPWDQCRQDGMALIVRSNDLLELGRAVQLLPRAREVVLSLKEAGIAHYDPSVSPALTPRDVRDAGLPFSWRLPAFTLDRMSPEQVGDWIRRSLDEGADSVFTYIEKNTCTGGNPAKVKQFIGTCKILAEQKN
jgi:hypothetical protein